MVKVILCGHGHLAQAMKEAIEMVYGNVDSLLTVNFEKSEGKADLEHKMAALISEQDQVLIVVDLFGGSPFNAAASLALTQPNIEVVAGMSLPLCLELVDNLGSLDLANLVDHLLDVGPQCVKKLSKTVVTEEEEDFI